MPNGELRDLCLVFYSAAESEIVARNDGWKETEEIFFLLVSFVDIKKWRGKFRNINNKIGTIRQSEHRFHRLFGAAFRLCVCAWCLQGSTARARREVWFNRTNFVCFSLSLASFCCYIGRLCGLAAAILCTKYRRTVVLGTDGKIRHYDHWHIRDGTLSRAFAVVR